MERAIQHRSNFQWNQFGLQWTGKIEEARYQSAQPVGLGRDVSRQFIRQRIRLSELLVKHFRRAFDYPERIANLVRQAGGHLPESRQPFGTPSLLLRLL